MNSKRATMTDMAGHPFETKLVAQLRARMEAQNLTQSELGRRLLPDTTRPEATVGNYLSQRKSLLTGMCIRLLEELGAEEVEIKWKQ